MSRTTQDPPRLITRSMTHSAVRRSPRLRSNREGRLSSSTYQSQPSVVGPAEVDGTKKRKKPAGSAEAESQIPKSRRQCGQIEVRLPRKAQNAGSHVTRGPSTRSSKIASCNQESSKLQQLEEQLDIALQAKRELAAEVKEHKINSAKLTLKHLEEYFTCPLCFEVMACPYALVPRNCGHTFCATCILKWVFSRLHKECGGWHEAVDCPLCRSVLPHTPERAPRPASCFPFIPNRTADTAIRGLINTISHELTSLSAVVSNPISDWREDGHSKQDWFKREESGRAEMTLITAQWNTLKSTDFVNIKNRLEV